MRLRRVGVASLVLSLLGAFVAGCGGSPDVRAVASAVDSRGVLSTDSAKYRSPGTVSVTVADWDLNLVSTTADTTHAVTAFNLSTGKSLNSIKLTETDVNSGTFTGTFALDTKGSFEAADGDTIRITYSDANDGTGHAVDVTAEVRIDNASPNVSMASVTVAPTSVNAGETIAVTYTIANDAIGQASSGDVRVALQVFPVGGPTPLTTTWRYPGALAPGASFTETSSLQIPAGTTGDFWVVASVLTAGDLTNSNDSRTSAPFVVAGPHMTVQSVTFSPDSVKAGETIDVTYTVVNDPSAGAAAPFSVAVDVSNGPSVASASRPVPALAPGASFTETFPLQIPAGTSGPWYVTAWVPGEPSSAFTDPDPLMVTP